MQLSEHRNSKKQGDAGLGASIAYFTAKGMAVSLPLTDSQEYDLVVEEGEILKKVQVKTSTCKANSGAFRVELTTKNGNKSGQTIKKFDRTKVDYLFVLTEDGKYLIPSLKVDGLTCINLGDKYKEYLVSD